MKNNKQIDNNNNQIQKNPSISPPINNNNSNNNNNNNNVGKKSNNNIMEDETDEETADENEVSQNVYDLTGPGVFNRVLSSLDVPKRYYLYTCNQGNFTNEHFQYIDKPQGKWTKEQEKVSVLRPKADVTR